MMQEKREVIKAAIPSAGLQRGADRISIIPRWKDLSRIGYHENLAAHGMTLQGLA